MAIAVSNGARSIYPFRGRLATDSTQRRVASLLDAFVAERVKQTPKPDTVPDFPIAIVRK
jgi:hypothetical protein